MNKKLLKLVTSFAVMLVCISMVAMAAPAITSNPVAGTGTFTTTVNVTGVGTSDEVSLLVVKAGADLTKLVAGDVLYIDQKTAATTTDADTTGNALFTFKTSTKEFDVYSGYSTMALTDNPLSVKYDGEVVTGPEMDAAKSKLYTNTSPFGLDGYRRVFIKLTENNGNWIPAHSDAGSEIYYSTELTGYDGLVKTTATDLAGIFGEITWTSGTPSADATIAKYGDVSGDGNISAADHRMIKADILNSLLTTKQYLTGDVSDDAKISAADHRQVKAFVLETLKEFTAVTNRK